jgi:dihydroneopterin aldolase
MTKSLPADFRFNPDITEISIKSLTLRAQIGVFCFEKNRTQPLVLSARVWTDNIPKSDDLSETIDYNIFADSARDLVKQQHFELVETFLDAWAKSVLAHPLILAGEFEAEKPEAIQGASAAGVRIFRQK